MTTVKLGDIVSFKTGKLNSNAAKPEGEYPFFTCSQETFRTDTYSFDTECVLLGGNNANGIYPLKFFHGKFDAYQRTYVIESLDKTRTSNRYTFYALRPKLDVLKSISTGAATKFLTLTILRDLEIGLPPLASQQKIASILSAYDELIENNLKRIKILEEIAQMIYREWFINFRFPDHEKVKLVESELGMIPEGWEVKKLGDICNVTMGQAPSSEFYNTNCEGLPFHQGVKDFGNRFPSHINYCKGNHRIGEKGDILISVRAPVGRINIANTKIVIGRGLSAVKHKLGLQTFLLYQLKSIFAEEDTMGSGTIYKAITKEDLLGIKSLIPSDGTDKQFDDMVKTLDNEIEILTNKSDNLCKTRDLLLPKLISGEIDVENLDIRTVETEA